MADLEIAPSSLSAVSTRDKDLSRYTLPKRPWRRRTTPFQAILESRYAGSGTAEDPFLVEWLDRDPEDPQLDGGLYKWLITAQVSISTLSVSLASSAYSGAIESIAIRFPASQTVLTLGISLFLVGFTFGPLFWAPFSEVIGRRNLFIFTYFFFTIWNAVAIASPNLASLLVFRFLAGLFGSSPLVNSGGTIADMFNANERGLAMAVFASAPFLGPAIGPIIGGFIGLSSATNGWKWLMAFLALFSGAITLLGALTLPETYAPVLLRWRAQTLQVATGRHYICKLDKGRDVRLKTLFKVALGRPWKLLFWEPIVLLLSIYIAIVYGILYSLFGAFPIVYQRYRGWNAGVGGLAFLGVLVGMLAALAYVIWYENPRYIRKANAAKGKAAEPEERLPPAMVGAVSIVIGLAWFAATDSPRIHWIVSIMAGGPFGFGMVLIFLALMNYLTDSYLIYAASVLAANSVIRSLFGAAFPLIVPYMYEIDGKNGIHWGPAIGGLLSLICMPFPFLFAKYGARIRARCKFSSEAGAFLAQIRKRQGVEGETNEDKKAIERESNAVGTEGDAIDDIEAHKHVHSDVHDEETSHDSASGHSSHHHSSAEVGSVARIGQ